MALDKLARSQGGAEAQLAGQDRGGDDACQLAGIVTWVFGVSAAQAEEVEHGGLRAEDGATAYCANFDGGHGDGDLEIAFVDSGKWKFGLVVCGPNRLYLFGLIKVGGDGAGNFYLLNIVMQLLLSTFCAGS